MNTVNAKKFVEDNLKQFVGETPTPQIAHHMTAILAQIFATFQKNNFTVVNDGYVVKGVQVEFENGNLVPYMVY